MKKIILIVILFALLFSVSGAYSKEVNGWERRVYYRLIDRTDSMPEGTSKEGYNRVTREVAGEYGLTYGEINDIADRIWEQDLSEREWEIIDELDRRMGDSSQSNIKTDMDTIYREVAAKYGISLNVIYDIDMRAWGWF